MVMVRELLKKQNQLLGESLLHSDRLLYLHKSISLLGFDDIKKVLVEKLPHFLSIRYFSLFLYDKDKKQLELECHNRPDLSDKISIHLNDSRVMKEALTNARFVLEKNFKTSKFYNGKENKIFESDFFVCIPLMIQNEIIGVLNLNDNEKGFFSVSDLDFILNVTEFLSLSLSNARLFEKVERLSITDGLTGLFNYQHMQNVLKNETQRSRRYKSSLSLIILDVDFFKKVNDSYGHQKGDEILMEVASVVKQLCRVSDTAARYGGEEFVLILPETNIEGTYLFAERVRQKVADLRFEHDGKKFGITVSCGIAEFDNDLIKDSDQLIESADQALYLAKERGRNRTVSANKDEILKT